MSGPSTFTINLFHTGDEGAAFRLQRKPGEIQHAHLIQEESELSVKADLFSVLHGTRSPGGDAASLIVIDFLFTGSDSRRRRFREATIDVQFALENDKPGRGLEPVVDKIAPFGAFRMSPSTRVTSTTLSANATISGSGGPVALGIGGGWQETHSLNEEGWATMSGYLRIEGRIDGSCNAARWKLRENEQQKHGIPSSLRIAILLLPKSTQRFRAFVSIDTSVNILSATQQRIKRFLGGGLVDPIYFDEEGRRKPFGPQPVNVDINNLSHCDLGTLNFDGPSGPGPSVGVMGPVDLAPPALASSAFRTPPVPSPTPTPALFPTSVDPAPTPSFESLELATVVQRLQLLENRNRHLEERVLLQERRNLFLEERVLLLEKGRLGLGGIGGD